MLAASPPDSPPAAPAEPSPPAFSPTDDDLLKLLLTYRDIYCAHCRYNLRGVDRPRCPECGERLALPIMMRPMNGYGAGALAVWIVPLMLSHLFLWRAMEDGGHSGAIRPISVGFVMVSLILALGAVNVSRRVVPPRDTARYWAVTTAVMLLYAIAIAFLFIRMQ